MTIDTRRIERNHPLRHEGFSSENICVLIADQLGIDLARVTDQSHFMNDLGLDWLERLELVILVEEAVGIELPDDEVEELERVGDLIRYMISTEIKKKQLARQPEAA
jgi:acyl carrier protein